MRAGDLTSGSARLHESWKKLRAHWEATQLSWQDTVSREFDENYIAIAGTANHIHPGTHENAHRNPDLSPT